MIVVKKVSQKGGYYADDEFYYKHLAYACKEFLIKITVKHNDSRVFLSQSAC